MQRKFMLQAAAADSLKRTEHPTLTKAEGNR